MSRRERYERRKRALDVVGASAIAIATLPITVAAAVAVYVSDRRSPLYLAKRVGRNGEPFTMVKLRSMAVDADTTGVESTASDDERITAVGRIMRQYKIDEVAQVVNVFSGQMSLVGPRPNTERAVAGYTGAELELLSAKPGLTDLASIVFANEGDLLRGSSDPDADYEFLIRPRKSALSLIYIRNRCMSLDLAIIALTALSVISRPAALLGVAKLLAWLNADPQLALQDQAELSSKSHS